MNECPNFLILRADGGKTIGLGHIMRCTALANAWQALGREALFVTCEGEGVEAMLEASGVQVMTVPGRHPADLDLVRTSNVARAHPGAWVVCDGYGFDAQYTGHLRRGGNRVLLIDDAADAATYDADLILNQSLATDRSPYPTMIPALLGPRYALLRREFATWLNHPRPAPAVVRRILLTMGGSDPENVTATVLREVAGLGGPATGITVLVGGANPHWDELAREFQGPRYANVELVRAVTDVPERMAAADLAISAAGSTTWELCFIGVPSILLSISPNEQHVADAAQAAGAAVYLGPRLMVEHGAIASAVRSLASDHARRADMSRRARELVDGLGARRVALRLLARAPSRSSLFATTM